VSYQFLSKLNYVQTRDIRVWSCSRKVCTWKFYSIWTSLTWEGNVTCPGSCRTIRITSDPIGNPYRRSRWTWNGWQVTRPKVVQKRFSIRYNVTKTVPRSTITDSLPPVRAWNRLREAITLSILLTASVFSKDLLSLSLAGCILLGDVTTMR